MGTSLDYIFAGFCFQWKIYEASPKKYMGGLSVLYIEGLKPSGVMLEHLWRTYFIN